MRRQGFTLIEVIAAMMIIGIAFIAILRMYTVGLKISRLNRQKAQAYTLLASKLEELKAREFVNIVTLAGMQYPGFPEYTLDVTQTWPFYTNPHLKRIDVSVRWLNPYGSMQTETVSTLRAEY